MKLLFLRGRVPVDRDPRQIMFSNLTKCDDTWTQLASHLSQDGYGEVWYWGGKRKVQYRDNFIEKWVPDYQSHKTEFVPDVVFARGGFPQYDAVLQKYKRAFKIYYGAGKRFIPKGKFRNYNLILVDTPQQLKRARSAFSTVRCELFIKSAADNVFCPQQGDKKYDVIFSSNEHKSGIKGHNFILPAFPSDLKMVQVGICSSKLRQQYKHIYFTEWIPRYKIPKLYAQAKVAIVCCTNVDSCPRVIPEALACNCPLLVLDTVNLWREKYITPATGRVASAADFINELRVMVKDYENFSPYNYYRRHLSLRVASDYLKELIE